MEIKSAAIVSVIMAALIVNTFAAYAKTSGYSPLPYSEVDSIEQSSSESAYPAMHYHYASASATSAYSRSAEDSAHVGDDGEERDRDVDSGTEYSTYKVAEYATDSHEEDSGYDAVSYTSAPQPAPLYNELSYTGATYSPPDYSTQAYTAPSLDVPVYTAPAVLPYWMRSGYLGNNGVHYPIY